MFEGTWKAAGGSGGKRSPPISETVRRSPLTTSCQPACCRAMAFCRSSEPSSMDCRRRAWASMLEGAQGDGNATRAAAGGRRLPRRRPLQLRGLRRVADRGPERAARRQRARAAPSTPASRLQEGGRTELAQHHLLRRVQRRSSFGRGWALRPTAAPAEYRCTAARPLRTCRTGQGAAGRQRWARSPPIGRRAAAQRGRRSGHTPTGAAPALAAARLRHLAWGSSDLDKLLKTSWIRFLLERALVQQHRRRVPPDRPCSVLPAADSQRLLLCLCANQGGVHSATVHVAFSDLADV